MLLNRWILFNCVTTWNHRECLTTRSVREAVGLRTTYYGWFDVRHPKIDAVGYVVGRYSNRGCPDYRWSHKTTKQPDAHNPHDGCSASRRRRSWFPRIQTHSVLKALMFNTLSVDILNWNYTCRPMFCNPSENGESLHCWKTVPQTISENTQFTTNNTLVLLLLIIAWRSQWSVHNTYHNFLEDDPIWSWHRPKCQFLTTRYNTSAIWQCPLYKVHKNTVGGMSWLKKIRLTQNMRHPGINAIDFKPLERYRKDKNLIFQSKAPTTANRHTTNYCSDTAHACLSINF